MALEIIVFTTNLSEKDLFLLALRAGWPHTEVIVPYHYYYHRFDLGEGWITYLRRDCEPDRGYKVGVAGGKIITTKSFEAHVLSWLHELQVLFAIESQTVSDKGQAMEFLAKLRRSAKISAVQRKADEHEIRGIMATWHKANDRALLKATERFA
jgi:hypothetical protein